jgi:hypothetical protein
VPAVALVSRMPFNIRNFESYVFDAAGPDVPIGAV